MAPLYAAVMHGCQAGKHQEALDEVYCRRILRGDQTVFSWRILGAFGADLAALSSFYDEVWSSPTTGDLTQHNKASLLNWTGFCLRAVGRLTQALQVLQHGLEVAEHIEDWGNGAFITRYLSEICLTIGDVAKAVDYGKKSVQLADLGGDGFLRLSSRAGLADAQHQAWNLAEAEDVFREAEKMQKARDPEHPILYALQGYKYCDLLLAQGKYQEVKDRAIQNIKIARERNWIGSRAYGHLSLSRAHLMSGEQGDDFMRVADYLEQAVDGLRQAGSLEYVPRGLLARAEYYRVTGALEKTQRDLDEAFSIATRGGMRLHLADCHLEYARLALALGRDVPAERLYRNENARGHLAIAKKMIAEMGYHRHDKEVIELEKQMNQ